MHIYKVLQAEHKRNGSAGAVMLGVIAVVSRSSSRCSSGKGKKKQSNHLNVTSSPASLNSEQVFQAPANAVTAVTVHSCTRGRRSSLTGSEYSRMARKSTTMVRRMRTMKRHLNLFHTMNFMVLHGLVNQKKDVSGRLREMNS